METGLQTKDLLAVKKQCCPKEEGTAMTITGLNWFICHMKQFFNVSKFWFFFFHCDCITFDVNDIILKTPHNLAMLNFHLFIPGSAHACRYVNQNVMDRSLGRPCRALPPCFIKIKGVFVEQMLRSASCCTSPKWVKKQFHDEACRWDIYH